MSRTFKHIPSSIGAFEAEEVGVEHLLRDVNDPSVSTLANQVSSNYVQHSRVPYQSLFVQIKHKTSALSGLKTQLLEMKDYLENVLAGKLPANNQVVYNIQTAFNLLPNLNVEALVRALLIKTNDMHLVIYISSLIRSVTALHDLVRNKLLYPEKD